MRHWFAVASAGDLKNKVKSILSVSDPTYTHILTFIDLEGVVSSTSDQLAKKLPWKNV